MIETIKEIVEMLRKIRRFEDEFSDMDLGDYNVVAYRVGETVLRVDLKRKWKCVDDITDLSQWMQ